jgi:hypothetical protein
MSESFIPHPPSPQPEKKDSLTVNKKNLAIAFLAVALFFLFIVLLVPGDNKDTSTNTPAPVATDAPAPQAPSTNKYDDYMDHVLNNSGKANSWSKSDIIEFGDLVCQALDEGNSVRAVVNLLNGYASTTSDVEFFASIMTGAVLHICPEYKPAMSAYLNN